MVIVLLFFLICLIIGIIFSRRQRGFETFVLADRSLGFLHSLGTVVSTSAGFSIVFVHAIYGYEYGISVMWSPPAVLIAFLLFALFIPKLKVASDKQKYETYADMLLDRYDRKTQTIGSILTILAFLAYASINVYGIGLLFSTILDISFQIAVLLGAGIVVVYVLLGGFWAIVYTDLLQMVVTIIGLACLVPMAYVAVSKAGGLTANLPTESFGATTCGIDTIIGTYIVVVPYLFASQDIWQRVFAAKNMRTARSAVVVGGFLISVGAAASVYLGMCSRALLPDINTEYALPRLITYILPSGVMGLAIVAYLAAFTSTADSCLLVISSAITQDFYRSRYMGEIDERKVVAVIRIVTLVSGTLIIAIIIAIPDVVKILFTVLTWSLILVPTTLAGFFWKRATANAAFWSILVGLLVAILYAIVTGDAETMGIVSIIPTLITLIALSCISKNNPTV